MTALQGALLAAACALTACTGVPAPTAGMPATLPGAMLEGVTARTLELRDFRLASGAVLPRVTVAYETYGELAADGRNAILVTHGNTSSFHAAGHYAPGGAPAGVSPRQLGWWNGIIGPGKPVDTTRYFVVSSNMLGGAYGTTGPRSIDPATGRPYGPSFPDITLADMVAVQHALLESLGVRHLVAVAGPSYGGFLAFEWGIRYPAFTDGLVVVVSAPDGGHRPASIAAIERQLARDPNWNGGWYYERGGVEETLTDLRVRTLEAYGLDRELAASIPDRAAREAEIRRRAAPWARSFDANSLIVQRKAMEFRTQSREFPRIKAKVLYILSSSDRLFPPTLAPRVMGQLREAGVEARYFEIESNKGHSAGTADAARFGPVLRQFLEGL